MIKIIKRKFLLGLLFLAIILFILIFVCSWYILREQQYIVRDEQILSTTSVALVFGGGMQRDGNQTQMQADRVSKAVELYSSKKVSKIMMTGDDGANNANEVDAMWSQAKDLGVPISDILIDRHGYRTYESCYREANILGIKKVVAVSQSFHLPRIIYFCRHFGIETIGVSADLRSYGWQSIFMNVREWMARVKGVWQVEVTNPLPRNLEK